MVEAALFSAGKPISIDDISTSTGIEPVLVKLYLKKLMSSYSRRETSLELIKAGKKYSLRIQEPYVERIATLAAPEVNPKLLKTAALIAYHQPMRQSELVEMYGSKIYDHVKELGAQRDMSTSVQAKRNPDLLRKEHAYQPLMFLSCNSYRCMLES